MPGDTKPEKAPKNYFAFHIFILRIIGVNIHDIENPILRYLYYVYSFVFTVCTFVAWTLFELIYVFENKNDLELMSFLLCYWISYFVGCLKLLIVRMNKKNVRRYLMAFEEGFFKPDVKRGGVKEIQIIKRANTVANTQATLFYTVSGIIIISRVVWAWRHDPLIYSVYDAATNTSTEVVERTLPWESWIWYNPYPTPYYQLTFFWEVWCVTFFGVEIGIMDILMSTMMVHLNAQFRILNNAVVTVLDRAKKMQSPESHDVEVDSNVTAITSSKLNEEGWEEIPPHDPVLARNFELCVKNCLEHHMKIIALSDDVENQFNVMILVQLLGSTIIFCFQLVQLSVLPLLSIHTASMMLFLSLMIFQLGIYCYNGNEITVQSENIATAAYNLDWFAADNRVKKYLVLMMQRAQRPIRMTAGKFVFLSLATFMSTLRGSVSYYMVIHQENTEE